MLHRGFETRACSRLGRLQRGEQMAQLPLARGWADVLAHLIVEHQQSRGVALPADRQMKDCGGHEPRVVHFGDRVRGKQHRIAGVQQNSDQAVGLAAIALQVHPVGAGEHVPVHVPQIVARGVCAVFGEFLAETQIRRAMQAGHEAVHHGLGHQVETRNGAQHGRIQESRHAQPRGGGICASSWRRISSESTRSDSAWKLIRMRWRSTGIANATISS